MLILSKTYFYIERLENRKKRGGSVDVFSFENRIRRIFEIVARRTFVSHYYNINIKAENYLLEQSVM